MPLIAVFATFPYYGSLTNSVFRTSEKRGHANTKHVSYAQFLIVFHRSLMFLLGRGGRKVSAASTAA